MHLIVELSSTGAAWSVDAQPSWNVLFLRQLACHHFEVPLADFVLHLGAPGGGEPPLDDAASIASLGFGESSRLELRSSAADAATGASSMRRNLSASVDLWIFCYDCETARLASAIVVCASCSAPVELPGGGATSATAVATAISAADSSSNVDVVVGDCGSCGLRGGRFRLDLTCSHDDGLSPHPTGRCVALRELRRAKTASDLAAGGNGPSVCCVCSDSPPFDQPLLAFPCGHAACLPCFRADAAARLHDARLPYLADNRGLTIDCPAECRHPDRYLTDAHAFRLLGSEAYERVKLLGAQRALLAAAAGHVMCPVCAAQYELPLNVAAANGEVTCEPHLGGCGARICLACRALAHTGACCAAIHAGDETASSLDTIRRTAKLCPRCRAPTERDGGCMHMTCRLCRLGWCWICQVEWSQACQSSHWFG